MSSKVASFAALRSSRHSIDFALNDKPKCPHCGNDFDIADNEAWFLFSEDGPHEVTCPSCEGDFQVQSWADWRFSTDTQDDMEDENLPAPPASEGGR